MRVLPVANRRTAYDRKGRGQDHQHRLDAQLSRRRPRAKLHRVKIGRGGADQGTGERMSGQGPERQRHRPGLYRDQQHRSTKSRRGAKLPDHGTDSSRALGRGERHWRGRCVPCIGGCGLCERACAGGGWGLAGAVRLAV